MSTASSSNGATNGAASVHPTAMDERATRDTDPCDPPSAPPKSRRMTVTWWRAVLIQPGRAPFPCTSPFLAAGEEEALKKAVEITGRSRLELEVFGVDAPPGQVKGGKR